MGERLSCSHGVGSQEFYYLYFIIISLDSCSVQFGNPRLASHPKHNVTFQIPGNEFRSRSMLLMGSHEAVVNESMQQLLSSPVTQSSPWFTSTIVVNVGLAIPWHRLYRGNMRRMTIRASQSVLDSCVLFGFELVLIS